MDRSFSRDVELIAGLTEIFLRQGTVPTNALPGIIAAFDDILSSTRSLPPSDAPRQPAPVPKVVAKVSKPASRQETKRKPRAWKPVLPTNIPTTPFEKLVATLKRSPLRLDDRSATAIARASGKPVGRDKLERAEQAGDRLTLTFGFDFGSAKFTAEFDVQSGLGSQAMTALMEMLDAGA